MLSNASNIAIERGFVLDDGVFCSHVTYNLQLDTRPEKSLYAPLEQVWYVTPNVFGTDKQTYKTVKAAYLEVKKALEATSKAIKKAPILVR